ncbi:hypothetical protein [Acidithiobacillus caldus]|uniref:Uncharacterized protein n=1 Tax=Acidithiobacillus caldus TaxID=33059 RepID=A0A1E7Z130_9PROT|nr:hypothetical protein [Acidithiobacillus caldus]OFC36613.1 hypothetical protein BAE27_05970 [Acidithiobacillus caldus]OFC38227.1 hypothetical protein BAE29_09225 [Acidithiobacillus caldus]OFC39315.1 hypothetical protein BAE28_03860 [Acidithiobacillus caldus]OFC62424.1 hypothetical protein BAE30_02050 [Acidithiobacillus caldus]
MANCTTASAHEVARLFSEKLGLAVLIRSDGAVLRRDLVSGVWKRWRRIKPGVTPQAFVTNLNDRGWRPLRRGEVPTFHTVERWTTDGIAEATDGCTVEPDGNCPHGCPSWCKVFGIL